MAEASQTKKPGSGGAGTTGGGTYYAWSTFPTEFDDYGHVTESISVGEEVSQSDLGVSDEEWEYLIETGAVSEDEYPDIPSHISPAEYNAQVDLHSAMVAEVEVHQNAMDSVLASDDEPTPVREEAAQAKASTSSSSKA